MEEELIAAIFKRPAIWDPRDKLRRNSKILNTLWTQVADDVKIDVKLAKSKWKNLRSYFVSEHRKVNKIPKSGSCGAQKKTSSWSHYHQLMFLRDTIGTNDEARESSILTLDDEQMSSEQIDGIPIIIEEVEESDNLSQSPHQSNIGCTSQQIEVPKGSEFVQSKYQTMLTQRRFNEKKRKIGNSKYVDAERAEFLDVEKKKLKLLKEMDEKENNSDLDFFKGLLPHMKNLTIVQKLRVQSKFYEILLHEYEKGPVGKTTSTSTSNYCTDKSSSSSSSLFHKDIGMHVENSLDNLSDSTQYNFYDSYLADKSLLDSAPQH